MSGKKLLSLKSHKRKPRSLDSFSPSLALCILSGLLSGDIHIYSFILRTALVSVTELSAKQETSFHFRRCTRGGTHIPAAGKGKAKGIEGHSAMFFFSAVDSWPV